MQPPIGARIKRRDLQIVFFRSNRISNRIGHPIRFQIESSNRIGRIHTMQAGLQAIGILYLWRTRVMYGLRNSELSTCLFQSSHKTRQTMLLYAYFTPKVDFKRKFNHQQSWGYRGGSPHRRSGLTTLPSVGAIP